MRFNTTTVGGLVLLTLASLASPIGARAVDINAVSVTHGELTSGCTGADGACFDVARRSDYTEGQKKKRVLLEDPVELGHESPEDEPTTGSSATAGGGKEGGEPSGDTSIHLGSTSGTSGAAAPALGDVTPADLQAKGYTVNAEETEAETITYTVTKPGVAGALDILDVDADSVGVSFARNGNEPQGPTRLGLRQIVASSYKAFSGQPLGSIRSVNYQELDEANAKTAMTKILQGKNKSFDKRDSATLLPGDPDFDTMMQVPFGKGATQMIAENPELNGRTVTSIDLFPTESEDLQYNFSS